MNSQFQYASEQYEYVRSSRKVLLEFCAAISSGDFIKEHSSFGRGSIRNLLVHIANVYENWIGKHGLARNISFTTYQSVNDIVSITGLFEAVDVLVYDFIRSIEDDAERKIDYELNGVKKSAGLLQVFSHTITHEFHHKGQVLSLGRHLGYIPVDTDIIR